MAANKSPSKAKKEVELAGFCGICGAEAAGRHYGSVCCSGCKGFFRRSVRFQKLYRCPYAQQCAISKMYRNCCRACRFQKCLQVGLDPKLVHGDWGQSGAPAPNEANSRKINTNTGSSMVASSSSISSPSADSLPNLSPPSPSHNDSRIATKEEPMDPVQHHFKILNPNLPQLALGYNNRLRPHLPKSAAVNWPIALSYYFVAVERLCDRFVDCPLPQSSSLMPAHPKDRLPAVNLDVPVELALKEPGRVSPRFPIGWAPSYVICKSMLQRVYCRVMVHYFDWASHVPELAELSEDDKQTLVVKRAMRCIWLLCAFRSAALNCGGIVCSCQMMFPYGPSEQDSLEPEFKELFKDSANLAFADMVLPFRQLHVSEPEYALLRVLCLFTPVSRLSESGRHQVLSFQTKYLSALTDLVRRTDQQGGGQTGAMLRISRLMMFLATAEASLQFENILQINSSPFWWWVEAVPPHLMWRTKKQWFSFSKWPSWMTTPSSC